MNKQQREYAEKRIREIAAKKEQALRVKYGRPAVRLNGVRRLQALKLGNFKIKPGLKKVDRYSDISDVFIFTEETEEFISTRLKRELQLLENSVRRLRDKLYLGDALEALALLEKFENQKGR